jgi:polyphosphate kinase
MITIAGTTRDKVLEMLPQRTQPSPLLETLIMDLKVSNELKMRLHGALSLARILQLRWDGKPQLHERYLNSLVPGIHPTSVAKLDLFLDLVRVHEELWLKHYAQGKQS